jgi:hypothetical protein
MVLLGGLELVAAGYFVHKHQQNKKERQRLEDEEEEEYERQRAERHAQRRERREKRSESAPPVTYKPRNDTKYRYGPPPPDKAHTVSRPAPTRHWVPTGPPPPIQYTPQPMAAFPPPQRRPRSSSPPAYKAQPYFSPPPQPELASSSTTATPMASHSFYDPPIGAYEMNGGEVPPHHLYANTHIAELRTPSPPLGERPAFGSGQRRARSNSRVRFALPVEGDEARLVEVIPGSAEAPGSPPPPYRP